MADRQFFTRESATTKATEVKAALAASKLLLFASTLVPNEFTTKAALDAAEIAADGYTPGGYALAVWTGPVNDPSGGAIITSPIVNVAFGPASDPPVTATVGGFVVEDASGDVRVVGVYDPPRPLTQVGDGWTIVVQDVEGRNAIPVPG